MSKQFDEFCPHDWVGDEECVYCANEDLCVALNSVREELSTALSERDEAVRRVGELETALRGAVLLCEDCRGVGGWQEIKREDGSTVIPAAPCWRCAPFRAALGEPK